MASKFMQVPDEEVERLAKAHGPRSIAAQVLAELRAQRAKDRQVFAFRFGPFWIAGPGLTRGPRRKCSNSPKRSRGLEGHVIRSVRETVGSRSLLRPSPDAASSRPSVRNDCSEQSCAACRSNPRPPANDERSECNRRALQATFTSQPPPACRLSELGQGRHREIGVALHAGQAGLRRT